MSESQHDAHPSTPESAAISTVPTEEVKPGDCCGYDQDWAQNRLDEAEQQLDAGDHTGALTTIDNLLPSIPESEITRILRYMAHLVRLHALLLVRRDTQVDTVEDATAEDKLEELLAECQHLRRLIPQDVNAYFPNQQLRYLSGNLAHALLPMLEYAALNPDCNMSRFTRVWILQDRSDSAAETYDDARRLVETVPEDPTYWRYYARAAEATGRTEEASTAFQRYLDMCGRDPALEQAHQAWVRSACENNDRPKDHPAAYIVMSDLEGPLLAFPHTDEGQQSADEMARTLSSSPLLPGMLSNPDDLFDGAEVLSWQNGEYDVDIRYDNPDF